MIGKMIHVLIYVVIIFSVLIVYARFLLRISTDNIFEQLNLINSNSQNYNVKISKINNTILYTAEIQKDFISWQCFIKKIFEKKDGLKFNLLSVDKNSQTLRIRGTAKTRENLLNYKDYLNSMGTFSEINLPFNSLLNKTDIDFEITAKILIDKIKEMNN